jgi:hypothetical protein
MWYRELIWNHGGMILTENPKDSECYVSVSLYPPQFSHKGTRARTWVFAARLRRVIAWVMALPAKFLTAVIHTLVIWCSIMDPKLLRFMFDFPKSCGKTLGSCNNKFLRKFPICHSESFHPTPWNQSTCGIITKKHNTWFTLPIT